jgi:hypothetical protein
MHINTLSISQLAQGNEEKSRPQIFYTFPNITVYIWESMECIYTYKKYIGVFLYKRVI